MSSKFDYAIPRAKYKPSAPPLRAPDGRIIPTFKKVRSCPRLTKLGSFKRRIIKRAKHGGKEYEYHATKGWRVTKQ